MHGLSQERSAEKYAELAHTQNSRSQIAAQAKRKANDNGKSKTSQ